MTPEPSLHAQLLDPRLSLALLKGKLTLPPVTDERQLNDALDVKSVKVGNYCLKSHERIAGRVPAMNYRGQGMSAALALALIFDVSI